jgi:hypothetical protein
VARVTTAFGVVFIGLGVIAYLGTAAVSVTALIPAIFGAVLALLGWVAAHERYVKTMSSLRLRRAPAGRSAEL